MSFADAYRAQKGTAKSRYHEACLSECVGAVGCTRRLYSSMPGTLSSHNVGEAVQDRLEGTVHIWQSQSPPVVWQSRPDIDGLQAAASLQQGGRHLKLARKQAPAEPGSLQSQQVSPGSWQPPSVLHTV